MLFIELLQSSPSFLYIIFGLLGLTVGSFLNVVILRLPKQMEQEWRKQCCELLKIEKKQYIPKTCPSPLRSQCPHCATMIKAVDNIPVLSFLLLKGRCRACHKKIAFRYPVIEILTSAVTIIVAIHFNISIQTIAALILSWALICLAVIDIDHYLLPDDITLPLLWLGLILNAFNIFTDIYSSLFGAVFGYLSLWSIYIIHKMITGKEGMGYGDFKLLAMLGAWLGWQLLPIIIIISSFMGAVIGLLAIMLMGFNKNKPIPFGPYLAISGWVSLLWGYFINTHYLAWSY